MTDKLISDAAVTLIVNEEVGSAAQYTSSYQRPEWPGGSSGITIGIGYDVGAGVKDKAQLQADWAGHIPDPMIEALVPCIGVTGGRAQGLLSGVRGRVTVPLKAAMDVFEGVDVPRWFKICQRALPNFDELSLDCKGALVSLAYNRGAQFDSSGDRAREMRAIKAHMAAREFAKIPAEFVAMKRLWEGRGLSGLLARRDHEADLFRNGLQTPRNEQPEAPTKPPVPTSPPVVIPTPVPIIVAPLPTPPVVTPKPLVPNPQVHYETLVEFALDWLRKKPAVPPPLPPIIPPPPPPTDIVLVPHPSPSVVTVPASVRNPLLGLTLDYSIGLDQPGEGADGVLTMCGYDALKPAVKGLSAAYCSFFDEDFSKGGNLFAPYLHTSDTAQQYNEGQIDPAGAGWVANLNEQFDRRFEDGFKIIEALDNADAYGTDVVLAALDRMQSKGLLGIAKNPMLCPDPLAYLKHPAIFGAICEQSDTGPARMNALRVAAGKPDLPVWFVAFGGGRKWADETAAAAAAYPEMSVSFYAADDEYAGGRIDLSKPAPAPDASLPKPSVIPAAVGGDFGSRVLRAMQVRNYPLAIGPDVINIIYIEGTDPNGKPNTNRPNAFDATRMVLRVLADGTCKILGAWDATTHSGLYYEHHLLNPEGAFHIALGQQSAWRMGIYHHGNYEALLNTEPLIGTRDQNENFKREGAVIREQTGAHHHYGYSFPKEDVGRAAAGCQVGRTIEGHTEFIALCKTDARYKADHNCLWTSTVLDGAWIV